MAWWQHAQIGDQIICVRVPNWNSSINKAISLAQWCAYAPVPGKIYTIRGIYPIEVIDEYQGLDIYPPIMFELDELEHPDDADFWGASPDLFRPLQTLIDEIVDSLVATE